MHRLKIFASSLPETYKKPTYNSFSNVHEVQSVSTTSTEKQQRSRRRTGWIKLEKIRFANVSRSIKTFRLGFQHQCIYNRYTFITMRCYCTLCKGFFCHADLLFSNENMSKKRWSLAIFLLRLPHSFLSCLCPFFEYGPPALKGTINHNNNKKKKRRKRRKILEAVPPEHQ